MFVYKKNQAIEAMDELGANGIPFVFLIDFEMKKIVIETDLENNDRLKFKMNGKGNDSIKSEYNSPSFLESYPIERSIYAEKFQIVKNEIQRGNSFLLNLSFPSKIVTDATLKDIYKSTTAKYKVYLEDEFVCFSPEIFVQIKEGRIASFPMKGTIDARIENAQKLILEDKKELAEHFTIVDLVRNDLSRVAKNVKVDSFRYIDNIATSKKDLLQVSSEVSGTLPVDYTSSIGNIIFKLLPAGSISGAPKAKTLEIIRQAEGQERGYYTGICGYFDGANLDSGVMIRYIEKLNNELYYRSGGGLTSMSTIEAEYQEMIDKIYLPISPNVPSASSKNVQADNG